MTYSCQYNPNVICSVQMCQVCGWNPEVAKARLEAFKKRMEEISDDSDSADS